MSLLDLYLSKTEDQNWQKDASFSYLFDFTTNFRDILSFEEGFKTFKKICDMTPSELSSYVEESPEKAKTFINNMMRTKLFKTKDGKRVLSAKGEVYEKFLQEKMPSSDRWFVGYLSVLDGYFSLNSNYIFTKTEKIFSVWLKAGYSLGQIYNALIYLFNINEGNMEEYLSTEYIVMISCLNDIEFLKTYHVSSEFEKNELHEYIVDNYTKGRFSCFISSRFSPSALIDCDTVLDDAKILFFSHYIENSHPISLEDMLDIFAQVYTRFYKLNTKKVMNFLMMYEDVYRMTYLNLFSDMQDFYSNMRIDDHVLCLSEEEKCENEAVKDNIDYTTTESINDLVKISSMIWGSAKSNNHFQCELHRENKCKYFLSKKSLNPYLEIHQLIPRDYANEFGQSIEKESNYIPLCPQCHRLVHFATDEERFKILGTIYRKRKERLAADGIVPNKELLFAIYNIEQDKLKPGENDFEKPLLEEAQPKLAAGKSQDKKTSTKGKVLAKKIQSKKKSNNL